MDSLLLSMLRMLMLWVSLLGDLPTVVGLQSARMVCLAPCVMSTGTRTMLMYSATVSLDLMETIVSVLFFIYLSTKLNMHSSSRIDMCMHVYQYRTIHFDYLCISTYVNMLSGFFCSIRPTNCDSVFELLFFVFVVVVVLLI